MRALASRLPTPSRLSRADALARARPLPRARIDTDDFRRRRPISSRRALTALTALVPSLSRVPTARADDRVTECFFDVAVEDRALGRIVVEIDETSLSGRRFIQLCEGRRGLSYRRTTLDSIEVDDDENAVCVKNAGVGSFVTPGTNSAVDVVGGASAERGGAEELSRARGRAKHGERRIGESDREKRSERTSSGTEADDW